MDIKEWPAWVCQKGQNLRPVEGDWGPGVSAQVWGLYEGPDGRTKCKIRVDTLTGPGAFELTWDQLRHYEPRIEALEISEAPCPNSQRISEAPQHDSPGICV